LHCGHYSGNCRFHFAIPSTSSSDIVNLMKVSIRSSRGGLKRFYGLNIITTESSISNRPAALYARGLTR
jgi:hypothetical protein